MTTLALIEADSTRAQIGVLLARLDEEMRAAHAEAEDDRQMRGQLVADLAEKTAQIAAFDAQVADVRRQADAALAKDERLTALLARAEKDCAGLRESLRRYDAEHARLAQEVEGLRSQLNARDVVLPDPVGPMFAGCKCGAYARMLGQDAIHRDDGSVHTSTACARPLSQGDTLTTGSVATLPEKQPSNEAANDAPVVVEVPKPRRGRPPDTRCRAIGCPATDATNGWPGSGTAYFCAVHGPVMPISVRLEWNRIFKAAQSKKATPQETAPAA